MSAAAILDAKGLKCPLPVFKAKKALGKLDAGETLEVVATDPSSVKDFAAFCDATSHDLVESSEADGVYTFKIKKGG